MKMWQVRDLPILILLPLLILGLSSCSKESPATAAFASLSEEFGTLPQETREELQNAVREYYLRFAALAEEYRGTRGALEAMFWIIDSSSYLEGTDEEVDVEAMIDEIFVAYERTPHIELLADYQYLLSTEQREQYFGSLLEDSPHANVRAASMYVLADAGARGDASDELKQQRVELLSGLIRDYADVAWNYTTYGEIAAAEMHPHDPADLEIGKTAPEITGKNVDGEEMRLSDYIGKVVVIDFWGDW
ncbi:peroxiredoxin family protein [Gemmatimonadota bacterium]